MSFEATAADLAGHAYLALSDAAARLWLRAAHWCSEGNSPTITAVLLKTWLSSKRAANELVAAGFWVTSGDDWLVPDRPESLSAKRARAGRAGGQASASKRASKTQANGQAKPEFASQANGVVPPLASPSLISGSSDLISGSPSFQPLSDPDRSRARAAKPERRKPRTQFPEGLQPLPRHRAKAAELRLDCDAQFRDFRNFHVSKGNVFADWHLAFDTWLSRAPAYSRPGPVAIRNGRPVEIGPNVDHDSRQRLLASRAVEELMAL